MCTGIEWKKFKKKHLNFRLEFQTCFICYFDSLNNIPNSSKKMSKCWRKNNKFLWMNSKCCPIYQNGIWSWSYFQMKRIRNSKCFSFIFFPSKRHLDYSNNLSCCWFKPNQFGVLWTEQYDETVRVEMVKYEIWWKVTAINLHFKRMNIDSCHWEEKKLRNSKA